MMFSREKKYDSGNFSEIILHKARLFHSKVAYSLYSEHEHYFSKSDLLISGIDTRCKVCGILLSEYRAQQKFVKKNAPVLCESNIKGKSSISIREIRELLLT